jgi:hypothetical protein
MTPEQMARFKSIREEDIDYSDIPDQSGFDAWRPSLAEHNLPASRNGNGRGAVAKKKTSVA